MYSWGTGGPELNQCAKWFPVGPEGCCKLCSPRALFNLFLSFSRQQHLYVIFTLFRCLGKRTAQGPPSPEEPMNKCFCCFKVLLWDLVTKSCFFTAWCELGSQPLPRFLTSWFPTYPRSRTNTTSVPSHPCQVLHFLCVLRPKSILKGAWCHKWNWREEGFQHFGWNFSSNAFGG